MISTHQQVLGEVLGDLDGRDVLDVGAGAGALVRWLRSVGARVTGAECGVEMRRRAVAVDPDHAGDYVDAEGQDLPFGDGSFDAVIYSYSLHHVPVDEIPTALREARRVLRPGGRLVVVEPAIDPPDRAIAADVVDETVERTAVQDALTDAGEYGFDVERRDEYLTESRFPDFDTWEHDVVGIDPDRAAAMAHHRDHARVNFERIAERRGDEWVLRRTNRLAVLTAR
jgi:ubiquinone/menaquinone biosynthesis C-methylase UbiE